MWKKFYALLFIFALTWSVFAQDDKRFTDTQLDQLLAPIALYPDPLLAQVLPAAAYPTEIQAASAWVAEHPDGKGLDEQAWDASVKAIARYPDVIKLMAEDIRWTTQLGEAYAGQTEDVTKSVQRLRRQAHEAGNLVSGPQQTVTESDNYLTVLPTDPQYIYVPTYDPGMIYNTLPYGYNSPLMFFGLRSYAGPWLNLGFDWFGYRSFYYPSGYYWGCNNIVYNNYGNPGWVRNNYSYCNSWSVNRNRYQHCRPYNAGYASWCNDRNYQRQWLRNNFTIRPTNNLATNRPWNQNGYRPNGVNWNRPNSAWNGQNSNWSRNSNGNWNRNTNGNIANGVVRNSLNNWYRPGTSWNANNNSGSWPRTTGTTQSWNRGTTTSNGNNGWRPGNSWSVTNGNNNTFSWPRASNSNSSTNSWTRPSTNWNSGSWARNSNNNSNWSRSSTSSWSRPSTNNWSRSSSPSFNFSRGSNSGSSSWSRSSSSFSRPSFSRPSVNSGGNRSFSFSRSSNGGGSRSSGGWGRRR